MLIAESGVTGLVEGENGVVDGVADGAPDGVADGDVTLSLSGFSSTISGVFY
jgi:hypothetical protein